jgi:hypothetical protein
MPKVVALEVGGLSDVVRDNHGRAVVDRDGRKYQTAWIEPPNLVRPTPGNTQICRLAG